MNDNNPRRFLALSSIFIIGAMLVYSAIQFLSGFVGALILFTLFHPLYLNFTKKKKIKQNAAAVFVILITIVIILLPFLIIGSVAVTQIFELNNNTEELTVYINRLVVDLNERYPQLTIQEEVNNMLNSFVSYLADLLGPVVQGGTRFLVNTVIMYFLLFYMLKEGDKWKHKLFEYIPFSKRNSKKLIKEFANVTNSTVISTGIIAISQGFLLGLSFAIVGIKGAVIWGVLAAILSFLPIVGTPILSLPAGIFFIATGQLFKGIFLIAFTILLITNIDNIIRPIVNKHVGNIHPLTSFIGVFFGLNLFGIMGLILGPLLISYFFLLVRMYKEEYL